MLSCRRRILILEIRERATGIIPKLVEF